MRGVPRRVAPELLDRVKLHEGTLSLFEQYHVTEQIHKALDRKVWLPSGGYLVIDKTEAMTVIDVNTGKHVGKANLEETVTKTNVEAAEEIARQLRLRDIGGIIIIDFIDMLLEKNKARSSHTLKARDGRGQDEVPGVRPSARWGCWRSRASGCRAACWTRSRTRAPTCEGRGIIVTTRSDDDRRSQAAVR